MKLLKNKVLIVFTILFFLIENVFHFWEGQMGIFAFFVFIVFEIIFIVLVVICLYQIALGIDEKFSKKNRNWTIAIMVIVLVLSYFNPRGIINYDNLEGEDKFIAQREGPVNCMTIFKLKSNNKFKERNVCFGVSEVKGKYEFKNDTIFFYDVIVPRGEKEYYSFGIIKKSNYNNNLSLFRYYNRHDTIGNELFIMKNDILK